ncbi:hypothetical protein SAMN05216388_103114 [Halorientalis persicus]|uniref:Elongation factor 1-beta n=1 Tax=Halorientalis persicus TaxID=1367881 RepID=A0A1H8UVQ7_9EURY|nr:hypothetical protein [Halorientalis persicus]SEP07300.1 hypothetical protein SAMN05216388_103114 [Halorientalis persicus]
MAITDTDTEQTTTTVTAVLAVRIPDSAGADLATDAEQRLGRIEGVRAVTVDGLRGLEPRFTATLVTVGVTIESAASVEDLRERLSDAVCVDSIDRLVADE